MSRPWKLIASLGASALLLAGCTGSDLPEASPEAGDCTLGAGPVSYVIGGRANTPDFAESPAPLLVASTQAAAANESTVTLFDTGGTPREAGQHVLTLEGKNSSARKAEQENNVVALQDAILKVRATSPEANPLAALGLAADAIRSSGGQGTVVVLDSGLQTTGSLDYTQPGMLSADPENITDALEKSGQLPDLSGTSVLFIGLGYAAAPQQALDTAARDRIRTQWEAIATAAGASCVSIDEAPNTAEARTGLPAVTPVMVPKTDPVIPTPSEPAKLALPFKSNSAEYIDPSAALASLQPLAEWLTESGHRVLLTGTTATDGDEQGRLTISQKRADAVRATLLELGANGSSIATQGVGTNHPTHVDDIGPNGELLPGPAAQNRLVIVSIQA